MMLCDGTLNRLVNDRHGNVPAWVPEGEAPFASLEIPGVSLEKSTSVVKNSRKLPNAEVLANGVLAGVRGDLARAITLVESNAPDHRPIAREILDRVSAAKPSHPSLRLGISGVPGAGKSTFIENFGNHLCDTGRRLAVLAVDPSSSISGGSILGDKTRMEELSRREECFIRPSPSGGFLGGVARKTRESILLCEAAGYDTILVETVGVGQSEIAVRSMVDCFLLLMIAGAGDELQGIKKGILEIADILAVNKADGDNELRARGARAELERAMAFMSPFTEGWQQPVLAISALKKSGLSELLETILRFVDHTHHHGIFEHRRREQALSWWHSLVEQELRTRFFAAPQVSESAKFLELQILSGQKSPSVAAEELLRLADF